MLKQDANGTMNFPLAKCIQGGFEWFKTQYLAYACVAERDRFQS